MGNNYPLLFPLNLCYFYIRKHNTTFKLMVLYNLKPKLSDSFEKNLIVQRRCYKTQSPNKCHSRLSGIILKTKKDSEQVGMTKYRIAQLKS